MAQIISSYPHRGLAAILVAVRSLILGIWIMWKKYKLVKAKYRYTWTMDRKSSTFSYRRKIIETTTENCSICLSEFEDGEEGREVAECKHSFHRHCLERWLLITCNNNATCPLCRTLVVPEVVVAEYKRVLEIEHQHIHWIQKELAMFFSNGSCN